jgi:hypothetical protein
MRAFRTIFQLNCHRLVGAFHEESRRIKLVQELQVAKEAQHKSGAAQRVVIVRTERASSWRLEKNYALKMLVGVGGGDVGVYWARRREIDSA